MILEKGDKQQIDMKGNMLPVFKYLLQTKLSMHYLYVNEHESDSAQLHI